MRTLILAAALLGFPTLAAAAEIHVPPAKCFEHPDRWGYDRDKEAIAAPGERFIADMRACDSTFAASVTDAVRYSIQQDEHDKFMHQSKFVIAAYAACWAVVVAMTLTLWLRQRRLVKELAELELRLKAGGGGA